MKYIKFENHPAYKVAIIGKESSLIQTDLEKYYLRPLCSLGMLKRDFVAVGLPYDNPKKLTSKFGQEQLNALMPQLKQLGVTVLYVTDGNYLKLLAKVGKMADAYGYPLPCKLKGYEEMTIIASVNHQALFANDKLQSKIDLANKTISSLMLGTYKEIGSNIIHSEKYIYDVLEIRNELNKLMDKPRIVCDIETFSLRHTRAGLGSIGFAWDANNGIAINVEHDDKGEVHIIKQLLRKFFTEYQGTVIYHNCTYDIKCLIYWLWMDDMLDQVGLHKGLEIMTRNFEDTKIIAYLATNSCAQNELGLKQLSHEYAGSYAVDVKDIRLVTSTNLLKYNLIDCLATYWVYEKYYQIMVRDNQEMVYKTLFRKMAKNIIQMELTGMPLNIDRVIEVNKELLELINKAWLVLINSSLFQTFHDEMEDKAVMAKNATLKKKVVTKDDVNWAFKPNSPKHLIALIHDFFGFDVLEYTETKQPSVSGDALRGHMARGTPEQAEIIQAIIDILDGNKIRNTFVNKFVMSEQDANGWHWLFGGFNIGGTKSGRLSSSGEINLQNLPSGSKFGKLIKSCFQAPPGWLFVGLDFASLEDRINTLLTCDTNKVKVYTDGYDGHSLRAYAYFKDQMPDIIDTVESINSISDKYPALRGKSKAPTFALTYQGTAFTLMKNCGFSEYEAKQIETNYHVLYEESDRWMEAQLALASQRGYAELAFGLRLRCPVLKKVVLGSKYTPQQASAEARTVGNAVGGQSYGLLNSRAGVENQERCIASKHIYDIKPSSQIHDAQYFVIRNNFETIKWFNDNLVECIKWQELPELQKAPVELTGNVGIFWPSWANEIELGHNLSTEEIYNTVMAGIEKYNQ